MRRLLGNRSSLRVGVAMFIFVVAAVSLFIYASPRNQYTEQNHVYDLIWMDAWAVMFFTVVVLIWTAGLAWRTKAWLLLISLSLYGVVEIALMYAGTPFGFNAFWGDQQFRQAMILKFTAFGVPGDFYYKGLPTFYPPVYYYSLAAFARLFSIEAYKMIKIGSMLIYFVGPWLLYYFWRKLVNPLQAFLVTLGSFLIGSFGYAIIQAAPHAFLASSFFIPWWLYYIERIKNPKGGLGYYLYGGAIGALLFSTYFYPFFVGAFLLFLRLIFFRYWRFLMQSSSFRWRYALGVLGVAALLSAPYWLPVMLSVAEYGIDRSRGGWHHLGSMGLMVKYMEFSLSGLLFLAAIAFALERHRTRLHRALLTLLGSIVFYLLLGSVLGALGLSINLIKARGFVLLFWGAFVGLAAAWAVRRSRLHAKARVVIPVLLAVVLLIFLHNINMLGKHEMVKIARKGVVPTWKTDSNEMAQRIAKVFLSGNPEIFSFYPIYSFISTNEHYSHPASRIKERLDLLSILQGIRDSYIFNVVLRHNIFDPVDYFMPRTIDSSLGLHVNMSNYPSGFDTRVLRFDTLVVSDSTLFVPKTGIHLYEVADSPERLAGVDSNLIPTTMSENLKRLTSLKMLNAYLDTTGQRLIEQYLGYDRTLWSQMNIAGSSHTFDDKIVLHSISYQHVGDTTYFLMAFSREGNMGRALKVYFHLFEGDQRKNFDFLPDRPTNTWEKSAPVWCVRAVPRLTEPFTFTLGFFFGDFRLGDGFYGRSADATQ